MLGDFLTHVQHFGQASRLLGQAADLAPHEPEVPERQALLAIQRPADALRHAERALRDRAARPLAHFLRAVALIQRAVALDPSSVGHQVTLGQVLLMSGDAAEAQRAAERARAAARTAAERDTVERLLAATLGAGKQPN